MNTSPRINKSPEIEDLAFDSPTLPNIIRYEDEYTGKLYFLKSGDLDADTWEIWVNGTRGYICFSKIGESPRLVGLLKAFAAATLMHGMQLGADGMHNQIRQWAEQPFVLTLFSKLIESGYRVFVTSDHGNTEARGCGNPTEGMLAETRGQRARIYSHESIRQSVHESYPDALAWDPVGLPQPCFPLLAPHRTAFVPEKATIVCHGGNSLAEMIVPLIELSLQK